MHCRHASNQSVSHSDLNACTSPETYISFAAHVSLWLQFGMPAPRKTFEYMTVMVVRPRTTKKVRVETCNISKTRHYLAFDYVKVSYEALFSSYGVICLPLLPLLAIWTSLKTILPTVACLAACRICLY